MNLTKTGLIVLAAAFLLSAAFSEVALANGKGDPLDWTYWRGPEMNGISREKNIPEKWSPKGENLLWKNEDIGGRSTPIVMNGKLYTLARHNTGTPKEQEKVVCVNAATGEKIWENIFNVFLSDVPDTRVGWSNVVGDPETGNVFALGVCGYFQCLNGETGETLWSHSLSEEYGLLSTYGGRTNHPIIHKNLVMISAVIIGWGEMAKPTHRFIAFDKRNGQPVWFEGTKTFPSDTTYSAPVITAINGEPQMIFGSGDGGVYGFQPQTGKQIWGYDVSFRGINTTPVVFNDGKSAVVFGGHCEENIDSNAMGALFAIDATKKGNLTKDGELWRVKEWFVGKSAPLYLDGRIYGCEDTGTLIVADAKTGKKLAEEKLRGPMRSSPLYVDGKIFICTENSIWWTLKPTAEGVEVVTRERLGAGDCYGSPIVSHGRLYVTTIDAVYCIGFQDQQPSADPIPPQPAEAPVDTDPQPAVVQVVPVESLLYPGPEKFGQRQEFQVRLYNSRGQYLKTVDSKEVKFSIDGPGTIEESGRYTTPKESVHAGVLVTAQVGDLKGTARIRVVPKLPWSFDFDNGQIPITWVGVRYRHVPLDFDLFQKIKAADPQAAQLHIYLQTGFVNSGRDALKYDDSTPAQAWTEVLRFLGLLTKVKTLDEAKQTLDPSLKVLQDEKLIAGWKWDSPEGIPVQLIVQKGTRGIEGNGVMVKVTTIPKGTRSQGWMGHTELHDYTIQADVLGADRENKLPDIGLIGQRYTLDMMGASQQLQIRTWPPQPYRVENVPFAWKPNVWYTMKLKTAVEEGKAVLRGKVWERGKEEPKDWSIQLVDELPNTIGSPGLYGSAKDAEIFYDNLSVTAN